MNARFTQILYWTPRILAILFAAFVSIFAFDVFHSGYTFWETVLALFMHLIPTWLLLLALLVAWRRPLIGGLMFIALGALYLFRFWGEFHWSIYLLMAGVPTLIGLLFLANHFIRARSSLLFGSHGRS